jgi:hypothetical protein
MAKNTCGGNGRRLSANGGKPTSSSGRARDLTRDFKSGHDGFSTTKFDQGRAGGKFVRKRVTSLLPSPENLLLYNPIGPNDPEIIKLANSIKKHGCDPLIVTIDNYIVSGHRRHVALVRNRQTVVCCRILPVRRDSMTTDEYVALLRTYNHQRHKSVAEQVREELIDIDPETAHRKLRELRDKSVYAAEQNGVATLHIEGTKRRHGISDQKADHVKYVKQVVFVDRRMYWPLSVRGVHYPLLNYGFMRNIPRKIPYKNDDDSYQATSDLITRMRLNGSIPWEAFDDGTRPMKEFHAFNNVRAFVRQEVEGLFGGYWRDLLQTQPNHIEVFVEKNTIYHMALRVTKKYQIPTSSGRGFNSIDPWHDLYERYRSSGKKRLIVIVLSDWDPEGEMIPQVGGRTLRDDFGVRDFNIIKAGVTLAQIDNYQLPPQNFAKESSSNHKWFVDRNGGDDTVYELEALDPENMLGDLEKVIQSVIDIDLFNREAAMEQEEAAYLAAVRKTAADALKGLDD